VPGGRGRGGAAGSGSGIIRIVGCGPGTPEGGTPPPPFALVFCANVFKACGLRVKVSVCLGAIFRYNLFYSNALRVTVPPSQGLVAGGVVGGGKMALLLL
jgi:hypothetical protein